MTIKTPAPRLISSLDRQVSAQRIARLLVPCADAARAVVSTAAAVALGESPPARPSVVLAVGEPPADGVLTAAPQLVVRVDARDGPEARWWLEQGVAAVWEIGHAGACEYTADGSRWLSAGDWLRVPGLPAVRLSVAAALGRSRGGMG